MRTGRLLLIAVLLFLSGGLALRAENPKQIALTFEKLPYMKPLGFWRPREISNRVLRTLEKEGIKAAGFVVQEKVEDDSSTYVVLDDWLSRGHTLGNQTWGDVDYNVITYDDFMEHATDGQKYLKKLSYKYDFNYRFLRFPLLHEGNEPRKKKRLRKSLDRGRYQIAHVTVKTTDWAFNQPYLDAEGDAERVAAVREAYLEHLAETLDYSEQQSEKVFGRQIPHVLQLRLCVATANFLPDLISLLRERGYQFVTLQQALDDEAYRTEEEYVGPLGLTFIDRVAATRGLPFDETAGELRRADVQRDLSK